MHAPGHVVGVGQIRARDAGEEGAADAGHARVRHRVRVEDDGGGAHGLVSGVWDLWRRSRVHDVDETCLTSGLAVTGHLA